MNILRKIDTLLSKIEFISIVALLSFMILLMVLQVILRNVFSTGFFWSDILLNHLVLWVGLLGASQATRAERHINVDVLTRLLNDGQKKYLKAFINLFSFVITAILARAAWLFLMSEKEAGTELIFGMGVWVFQIIIPVGLILIGYRFLLHFLESVVTIVKGTD